MALSRAPLSRSAMQLTCHFDMTSGGRGINDLFEIHSQALRTEGKRCELAGYERVAQYSRPGWNGHSGLEIKHFLELASLGFVVLAILVQPLRKARAAKRISGNCRRDRSTCRGRIVTGKLKSYAVCVP